MAGVAPSLTAAVVATQVFAASLFADGVVEPEGGLERGLTAASA